MNQLETSAIKICKLLLENIVENKNPNSSVKFFRKDVVTMTIWLFILKSFYEKKRINIEDIAREIAPSSRVSKPSLRLILENGRQRGFIKFTHNKNDQRSWVIEPETITINEFNQWAKIFV
jgi:DNA-binding MarR family transcriptional regulator